MGARMVAKAGVFFAAGLLAVALLSGCGGEEAAKADAGANGAKARAASARPAPPPQVKLVWPTPNRAFHEGRGPEAFVQPTESGLLESGLYGSTRSGGRQFHEGLDIFPIGRDAKGEATDDVFAALAGVVRHVSERAGASSYGRYVVMEHPEESPPVYTLYAHLADVAPEAHAGARLAAGARLGRMGRSAGGYTIPKQRAHLHFEIGVRVTDRFQAWYDGRKFGSRNEHGLYNGMNLMGLDPLDFYARHRAGALFALDEVFEATPAAVTVRIRHAGEPDYARRYPSLVTRATALRGGWEVDFSATGAPLRLRELGAGDFEGWRAEEARVLSVDQILLNANRGRELVRTVKGQPAVGRDLRTVLEQVFGWRG